MADCTNPNEQQISGAFPASSGQNTGALQVNVPSDPNSIFNPNLALAAMQTYNSLNSVANQMFGIEARWFRAIPQQRSQDVIFQEYTLSNVEETPICVKVMVASNGFPDSKYQFDLMGLEYEVPTEIQIDKKYWETTAGFGTAPQKKDIVYLPLPNKLYQVESSHLKRGFMEQETTWVVNLRKYQPEASRRESDILKETIDKYTVGETELFGSSISKEVEKLTDKKQMSPFNSTSRDEFKTLDPNLNIINYNLDINGIVAAQSAYDMNTSEKFNAVTYLNSEDYISTESDRAITAWIMPRISDTKEYDVEYMTKSTSLVYPANYSIKVNTSKRFFNDDVFVIYRQGSLNLYATVVDDSSSNGSVYACKIDADVETYLNTINANWASMKNYKMRMQDPICLMDGINETNHGLKVMFCANQYIKILYGSDEYVLAMSTKLVDRNWYGVVVNIGNTWGQLNAYVWKPSISDTTNKLTKVFSQTRVFTPSELSIDEYTLDRSDSYMTNIRLFKTTIEEEKQQFELLSYFSRDSDQLIIGDNADLRFTAPYVSRQR